MIILIPLGGTGKRFKKEGYILPKALIKVNGKEIIFHLIDNLKINNRVSFIYIPYNIEYTKYDFENLLKRRYPNYKFKFMILEQQTRGAAETIYKALQNLYSSQIRYPINMIQMKEMFDKPILCLDSDNFYTNDIINLWNGDNIVFSFLSKDTNPIFSYLKTDENENILQIIEKQKISDKACTGAYGFESYYDLIDYCRYIITNNITQKGEFYTSGVINYMLKKENIKNITIDNKYYHSLGTPEQVKLYESAFLFDLDGTLVNTDDVYIEVWREILNKYNITCNKEFFNEFIKGKADDTFLKYLSDNISEEEICEISKKKDVFFIEKLKESKSNILLDGVLKVFDKLQNSKIAIVTSCNRVSAEYILEYTGLDKYINILVSANDVNLFKPHPEPYNKAMDLLQVSKEKCIIFEDSYSGYCSAKNSKPYKICLIVNENSCEEIKTTDEFNINNYHELDIQRLLPDSNIKNTDTNLKFILSELENLPIKVIKKNDKIIKAGYICNINIYEILYNDNKKDNIILKISNLDNELSKTATELNLYKNELYFYKNISNWINVKIPQYYGSFMNDKKEGILMEDLNKYNGSFDVNLNKNIQLLLKVVYKIFQMHNKYYFESEKDILKSMKPLLKINQIKYYKILIKNRFDKFMKKNKVILCDNEQIILNNINLNFDNISDKSSSFPLSFCHGDLKSPNIFYKDNNEPYFLDWQYIHLNKGISDITFLLVESIDFDPFIVDIVIKYYYKLITESRDLSYEIFMSDFKNALCIFPFFVCVWFNSEDSDKLLDSVFPIKFMKNLLKYYNHYL